MRQMQQTVLKQVHVPKASGIIRRFGWSTEPVRRLRQDILQQKRFSIAQEYSHQYIRFQIQTHVLNLWKMLFVQKPSDISHEGSHGRKTICLRQVW